MKHESKKQENAGSLDFSECQKTKTIKKTQVGKRECLRKIKEFVEMNDKEVVYGRGKETLYGDHKGDNGFADFEILRYFPKDWTFENTAYGITNSNWRIDVFTPKDCDSLTKLLENLKKGFQRDVSPEIEKIHANDRDYWGRESDDEWKKYRAAQHQNLIMDQHLHQNQ